MKFLKKIYFSLVLQSVYWHIVGFLKAVIMVGGCSGVEWWSGGPQSIYKALKYSVWHYNDGYISLYICPNLCNVSYWEWTLRKLWTWVIVMCQCRFISYNKHTTLVGDVATGETMHMWGQEIYRKPLCLPLNFSVNITFLKSITIYHYCFFIWKGLCKATWVPHFCPQRFQENTHSHEGDKWVLKSSRCQSHLCC